MTKHVFADYYAAEGLSPSGEVIKSREAPTTRIVDDITNEQIIEMVSLYFGSEDVDLSWFVDEYSRDDAGFSLVNNARETRVLASAILDQLVDDRSPVAMLALVAGQVNGHRLPTEGKALVRKAVQKLAQECVADRKPKKIEAKVTPTNSPKLGEEIKGLATNDWSTLGELLGKIRSETQSSQKTTSNQASAALSELDKQIALMREETQMLWWIFGGHSKTLECPFASLGPFQVAIAAAVDLGELTPVSLLGPVAAPAMFERIIAQAKRPKGTLVKSLSNAIDGMDRQDLQRFDISPATLPARLAPVTAAIELARTIGLGSWHARFEETTGLKALIEFEPVELETQLSREYHIGELL